MVSTDFLCDSKGTLCNPVSHSSRVYRANSQGEEWNLDISDVGELDDSTDLDFTPYGTPFSTPMKERGSRSGSRVSNDPQRPVSAADVVQNLNQKFSQVDK